MAIPNQAARPIERQRINPWKWQEVDGFAQAVEIRFGQRVLYCSGQASVDPDGKPLHIDDMRAQINQALDNLETVLAQAGYKPADMVRLNIYTTDVDLCLKHFDVFVTRLYQAGCHYSCSLFGVARLAWAETMVEIEATAVA